MMVPVFAVAKGLDWAGGPGELILRRRGRAHAESDEPWKVLRSMLELEAAIGGRRPEHVLMLTQCAPEGQLSPALLEGLRVELLALRSRAVDVMRDETLLRMPDIPHGGRSYEPTELRSLADWAVEAVWDLKMPSR